MQGSKKFLFDLNNFDEPDDTVSEEDLIPTFSEEQLEQARAEGYAQGKADGIAEEKTSREQQVTRLLGQIVQTFQVLLTSEGLREQQYEEESLRLLHGALKTLFPILNKRLGMKEVEDMAERVVQSQSGQKKIVVRVPVGFGKEIETYLFAKIRDEERRAKLMIEEDKTLSEGECIMEWTDGGAVRNAGKLIETMILEVESLLPVHSSDSPAPEKNAINPMDGDFSPSPHDPEASGPEMNI